jgi:hypothetical protein
MTAPQQSPPVVEAAAGPSPADILARLRDLADGWEPDATDGPEFLIVHPQDPYALDWVAIEPCGAGGFKVWPTASTEERRYGRIARFPIWRPDLRAACATAWEMTVALLQDWRGASELKPGAFAVQVCDRRDVLFELPVSLKEEATDATA